MTNIGSISTVELANVGSVAGVDIANVGSISGVNAATSSIEVVRTLIIDVEDNYGNSYVGLRSLDMYENDVLVQPEVIGYTAAATTVLVGSEAVFAFDTSLSKTGAAAGASWLSSNGANTNQRVVCTLASQSALDRFVINNYHHVKTFTDRGIKNVKVYTSILPIDRAVWGQVIPNSVMIYDGTFNQHTALADVEDPQECSLIHTSISPQDYTVTAKSVVLDIADSQGDASFVGLRRVEFYLNGELVSITDADFTAYATTSYNAAQDSKFAFDTSLPTTGVSQSTSWFSTSPNDTNQRLIVVFNTTKKFDTILIVNFHHVGGITTRGSNAVVIHASTDSISDVTYGAAISNSVEIFNGSLGIHTGVDIRDSELVILSPPP